MKRRLFIILVLLLTMILMVNTNRIFAIDDIQGNYTLKYNILDEEKKTAEVIEIEVNNGYYDDINVEVPNSVILDDKEYKVTQIGNEAFRNCNKLKEIKISDSVTTIKPLAFWFCSNLVKVIVANSVTNIEKYAFCDCSNLVEINIPESVKELGEGAFDGCTNLSRVTISEGITSIKSFTFQGCKKLTEFTIPKSVTSIGESAFAVCSSFNNITIPKGVTEIGRGAFRGCSNLTEIKIPDGVTSIERETFNGCSSLNNITIPDSITNIGDYAFSRCTSLNNIDIPKSVTKIGDYAFKQCTSLENIVFPEILEEGIGRGAFSECISLTRINIPGIQNISESMFSGCSNLSEVTMPDCAFYICYLAFNDCSKLNNITIPENVQFIENEAFKNCNSLTEIIIPSKTTGVGNNVFQNCSEDLTIKAYKGSCAENYANENSIKFEFLKHIGDVDKDGEIDANDAVMILKYVAHNIDLTEEQFLLADINGDGDADTEDAVQILKYVAHNIELDDLITYKNESLAWPLPSRYARYQYITSYFEPHKRPTAETSTNHEAIDIGVAYQPVYAAESGTVVMAQYVSGYGNFIMLWHSGRGQLYTCYAHLSSIKVSAGQTVSRGQQIAVSGNTGITTGPHLHFEVRAGGSASKNRVDPLKYVKIY